MHAMLKQKRHTMTSRALPSPLLYQSSRLNHFRVLVIDNQTSIAQMLELELGYAGYEVTIVQDDITGFIEVRTAPPNLLILGYSVSRLSCITLCERLRHTGVTIPIFVITPEESPYDASVKRIASLRAGANDAMSWPFDVEEFLLRVQKQLYPTHLQSHQLYFEDMMLDRSARQVFRGQELIELTTREFDLLEYIMMHPGQVLTRMQILDHVWGQDFLGSPNIIEVYIRYLRLKIEAGYPRRLIQTIRGVGYVLRV
jgi:DNA-binding response OmpR family regulator